MVRGVDLERPSDFKGANECKTISRILLIRAGREHQYALHLVAVLDPSNSLTPSTRIVRSTGQQHPSR